MAHREREPLPVLALIVVPKRLAHYCPVGPWKLFARQELDAFWHPVRPNHAAQVRRVHPLSESEPLPGDDSADDPIREHDAANLVGHARRIRHPVVWASPPQRSCPCLRRQLQGGLRGVRPFGAITRGRSVYYLLVVLQQVLVSEAQPFGNTFAEILHENIRFSHKFVQYFQTPGIFEIKGYPQFLPVHALEICVHTVSEVGVDAHYLSELPSVVAVQ